MSELIKKSWDTAFFDFEVGSLSIEGKIPKGTLTDLLTRAQEKFKLLYLFTNEKKHIDLGVFDKNCTYIDERIIFEKIITYQKNIRDDNISVYPGQTDATELYTLAFESGKHSRFRMDKNFGKEQFKRLYRRMIDNSLTKEYADNIFIKESGNIEGFVTVKQNGNCLNIGLIAVNPDFQGKGVGSSLMKRVENYAAETGLDRIEVLTQQQNHLARAFYKKQGFRESRREYIYHLWF